jgi:hypothetical protein
MAAHNRDRDTARFAQILDTLVAARRRVTLVAGPPPPPEAAAICHELYWSNPNPKAAADAVLDRYGTAFELALQYGRPVSEIEAMVRQEQVGALRIGTDGEWRLHRERVRRLIWAADAAERFMRDHRFARYHPKNQEAAQY